MEELDPLEHLTEDHITIIKSKVKRSVENVDQILFDDVLTNVIDSKRLEIFGVETNGRIKELLRQRELREEARLNRIHIKLTRDAREQLNAPSISEGSVPKMYKRSLIPSELARWAKEIEDEVDRRLGLGEIKPKEDSPEKGLTDDEIRDTVMMISYKDAYKGDVDGVKMNDDVVASMNAQIRDELSRGLRKIKLRPERLKRFQEKLKMRFEYALAMPGKLVGNIMASSFGEAATQQTLNTFHASGDKNARKQITGFGAFNSLLEATENSQSNTLTIFMKKSLTGEQMRLNISTIQATTLSDLVESHRVFPSSEPMPRWEFIADSVIGINYDTIYPKDRQRFNLHAKNPLFSEIDSKTGKVKGRILEIKLNIKELFFRRISLSQIAFAIEQTSSDYRVVTSSMTIGLIRIYYKFSGLPTSKGDAVPETIAREPFQYTLENDIYPSLLTLRITGISGVTNVYVQNFKISPTIDFGESNLSGNVVTLKFDPRKVIMSGLRKIDIDNFINAKIRSLMKVYIPIDGVYDEDDFTYRFSTANLKDSITMVMLQKQLEADNKIKILETLASQSPFVTGDDVRGTYVSMIFDPASLQIYGFEPKKLAIRMASFLSGTTERNISDIVAAEQEPKIFVYGLTNADIPWLQTQLSDLAILSENLQEMSVRWYYSAEGRNLLQVMAHPEVDNQYTRGNNVVDVYRVLGNESCRSIYIEEIIQNVDSKIHPAHIELLADSALYQTHGDKPQAQNHNGMTKRGAEWGSRMWQETSTVAMEVGLGQVDNLQGFPSKIMMGTLSRSSHMTDKEREEAYSDPAFRLDFPEKWKETTPVTTVQPVATAEQPTKAFVPKPFVVETKTNVRDVKRRLPPKRVGIPTSTVPTSSTILTPQPTLFPTQTPSPLQQPSPGNLQFSKLF